MTPPSTYQALASKVNFFLLQPEWSTQQVVEGLELAKRYAIGVATVRPCDIDLAVRVVQGSPVAAASVAGYPHGFQNTSVKLYEVRDLLRRGARDVGVALAVAKLASREFQHIQTELDQLAAACHGEGARLALHINLAALSKELKIIAYTCAERAAVDSVAVEGPHTAEDLALLRKHLPDETGIQIGGVETLEQALALDAAGVARLATSAPAPVLDAWRQRIAPPPSDSLTR
jgi:deoxyribose-phosphate aldolase